MHYFHSFISFVLSHHSALVCFWSGHVWREKGMTVYWWYFSQVCYEFHGMCLFIYQQEYTCLVYLNLKPNNCIIHFSALVLNVCEGKNMFWLWYMKFVWTCDLMSMCFVLFWSWYCEFVIFEHARCKDRSYHIYSHIMICSLSNLVSFGCRKWDKHLNIIIGETVHHATSKMDLIKM